MDSKQLRNLFGIICQEENIQGMKLKLDYNTDFCFCRPRKKFISIGMLSNNTELELLHELAHYINYINKCNDKEHTRNHCECFNNAFSALKTKYKSA